MELLLQWDSNEQNSINTALYNCPAPQMLTYILNVNIVQHSNITCIIFLGLDWERNPGREKLQRSVVYSSVSPEIVGH